MKTVYVSLSEFLQNKGIIEKDRELFNEKGELIGYYLEETEVHLAYNASMKSFPISDILIFVKIDSVPIYNEKVLLKNILNSIDDYIKEDYIKSDKHKLGLPSHTILYDIVKKSLTLTCK